MARGEIQIVAFCDELKEQATLQGFDIHTYGICDTLPLLALTRTAADSQAPCIYLCAGIHGDEPAGSLALLELLKEGAFSETTHWVLCPAMNPVGLQHASRYAHCGQDLNRDYRHNTAYETQRHIAWIERYGRTFDLHLSLHEDWEARGFYLYEFVPEGFPDLTSKILKAASKHCHIDCSEFIDNFPADQGVIHAGNIAEDIYVIPYWPQGIYLAHKGITSAHYTFETPSSLTLKKRIQTHKDAVLSAINAYSNSGVI